MENSFNNGSQEGSDGDLPLKYQILKELLGGENFTVFYSVLSKQFPDHPALNELIQKYLTDLLNTHDVQSLQLLSLEGLPSFIQLTCKQLTPIA